MQPWLAELRSPQTSPDIDMSIAIIGAGLAGAVCTHILAPHHRCVVFEKSRGFGGRLATRRGSAALREMVRAVGRGLDICVTPDGPRGPRYQLSPGLIKLAQMTGSPVMAVHIHFGPAFRLKTWDRFVLPLPFSQLTIIFDELLDVPRQMDDDAFEAKRIEVENLMRSGVDDLDLPINDHSERERDSG